MIRIVFAWVIAALLATGMDSATAQVPTPEGTQPDAFAALVADLRGSARARDSLSAIVDTTSGVAREVLEQLIAQRDAAFHESVLGAVDKLVGERAPGIDVEERRGLLSAAFREDWPTHQEQLERRGQTLLALSRSADAASGAERVRIEADLSERSDRLLEAYEFVIDEMLAAERAGIDASTQRAFLVKRIPPAAEGLVTRVQVAGKAQASTGARLSRDPSNAELRYAFEAAEERLRRASRGLATAILMMDRLHLPNQDLRVAMISSTGKLTTDVFNLGVLLGLVKAQWAKLLELVSGKAWSWFFQLVLILATWIVFRAISKMVERAVGRAVRYSRFSALMRGTMVSLAANVVMVIGFVVILTQLGVQIAPLLAGFGIAGVVVGFAMQNTLSNFAAGGMILASRPFDLGDEIEVAGVLGVVRRMSLVSTTILTGDNQTLILPNNTVWGGVIRNRSTQPERRLDLTFGIAHDNDVGKAERVLGEIVAGIEAVRKEPAPLVQIDRLTDVAVVFLVRVWTTKEQYSSVQWDLTRAVKTRFDQEGIRFPLPRLEVLRDSQSAEKVAWTGAGAGT